jgi:RNA recognition motif-containing protein
VVRTVTGEAVVTVVAEKAGRAAVDSGDTSRWLIWIYTGIYHTSSGLPVTNRGPVIDSEKGVPMNIYVGNLSLETTEEELREEFTEFGEVTSVIIMNDKYIGSGQPRGYGYVEMSSKAEGTAAIASMEGKKLRDRVVTVVEALPLSNKNGSELPDVNNNNRSYKKRERKYKVI